MLHHNKQISRFHSFSYQIYIMNLNAYLIDDELDVFQGDEVVTCSIYGGPRFETYPVASLLTC